MMMSANPKLSTWAGILLLISLPAPILIIIGASFSDTSYIQFPPEGLSLRWYRDALFDPR